MSRGGRVGLADSPRQTLPVSACPGIDGGGEVRMPRTTELGKIAAVDLAYAVGRLIQEGKTSLAEVRRFAEERPARVAALERELATLKAGHAAAKTAGRPAGPRAVAAEKPQRKVTMTPKARAAMKRQRQ